MRQILNKVLPNFTHTSEVLFRRKLNTTGREFIISQEDSQSSIFFILKDFLTLNYPSFSPTLVSCYYFPVSKLKIPIIWIHCNDISYIKYLRNTKHDAKIGAQSVF